MKSIMLYAAKIWRWKEAKEVKKTQEKFIKWTLSLDFNTPPSTYIILEETKTDKVRIEAGKRAVKYEEKTKKAAVNKIVKEC